MRNAVNLASASLRNHSKMQRNDPVELFEWPALGFVTGIVVITGGWNSRCSCFAMSACLSRTGWMRTPTFTTRLRVTVLHTLGVAQTSSHRAVESDFSIVEAHHFQDSISSSLTHVRHRMSPCSKQSQSDQGHEFRPLVGTIRHSRISKKTGMSVLRS